MNKTVYALIFLISILYSYSIENEASLEQTPESFKVLFKTSKGEFVVEAHKKWSPLAVQRFYNLVKDDYYRNLPLFRVVDGFVAQFGLGGNLVKQNKWDVNFQDEPVIHSNLRRTIAFARAGNNTRSNQIYINYSDNIRLDDYKSEGLDVVGYPPFAKVISGMEVVDSFFNEYGNEPSQFQDLISTYGNDWILERYPKLDMILSAELIKK